MTQVLKRINKKGYFKKGVIMKKALIGVNDLVKFLGEEKYLEFIEYLKTIKNIPDKKPIWIIAEWSE